MTRGPLGLFQRYKWFSSAKWAKRASHLILLPRNKGKWKIRCVEIPLLYTPKLVPACDIPSPLYIWHYDLVYESHWPRPPALHTSRMYRLSTFLFWTIRAQKKQGCEAKVETGCCWIIDEVIYSGSNYVRPPSSSSAHCFVHTITIRVVVVEL